MWTPGVVVVANNRSVPVEDERHSRSVCGRDTRFWRILPIFQRVHWSTLSTTPGPNSETQTFEVIHPFHPLNGKIYELVICRQNWDEKRAYYHDEGGRLRSIPMEWTNLAPVEPFVRVSAGRSAFRVADLLEVSRLLMTLSKEEEG